MVARLFSRGWFCGGEEVRVARVQFAAESLMQLLLLPSAVTVLVRDRVDWVEDEER